MDAPTAALWPLAALTFGLMGSTHCIGMCGGIIAALGQARGASTRPILYSVGRIASYATAGAIAGAAGMLLADAVGSHGGMVLRGLFGLLLIAAGLYLAGIGGALGWLERIVRPLWRRASRAMAPLLPADRAWKAIALGAIWGWLPCGLVYAALVGAAATGSGALGALHMTAFGLGTLPAILLSSSAAQRLSGWLTGGRMRATSGAAIALFGVWTILGVAVPLARGGHTQHAAPHAVSPPGDSAEAIEGHPPGHGHDSHR